MSNFAVYETDVIVNVLVADSKKIAEQVSGMSAIESVNGNPWIGWTLHEGGWRAPEPTDAGSWVWVADLGAWIDSDVWELVNGEWRPPMPESEGEWSWDSDLREWIDTNLPAG